MRSFFRRSSPGRGTRRGGALTLALVALAVIGISVVLVSQRGNDLPAPSSAEPERFSGSRTMGELDSRLPSARLSSPVRVAIIREPGTAAWYDDPSVFDSIIARWRDELGAIGAQATVVPAHRIAEARAADVILLPASPCVSAATRRAIDAHLAAGGGVLLTWLGGVRDGGCRPVGWQMVVGLTGATRADTLRTTDETYITVPAGGPLSFDIPPGARLEIVVANHVALRHPGRDVYWSDFTLNPAPVDDSPYLDGAVAHSQRARGRVVYWGFDLTNVVPGGWASDVARLLTRNSIAWAAGHALAAVEPWPAGARAAAVIAQDVEDEFANGRHALDSLRAAGVPGTFYVVTDLARDHAPLVRAMAASGEVGTHSENHRLLGGLPDSVQHRRLAATQETLRELTGGPVAGLRPPEEQFDVATLEAWAAAGGTYVFGANNSRSASPELIALGSSTLVLLGRTSNDDFISVERLGHRDPDGLAREYLLAYQKTRAIGGVYLLSYHSQMLSTPELVPAVAAVARRLAADPDSWVTTAGEVARWWRARHDVRVAASERDGSLEVVVGNEGTADVRDAVIAVALPAGLARPATASHGRLLDAPPGVVRVRIDRLGPGESRTIRFSGRGAAQNAD